MKYIGDLPGMHLIDRKALPNHIDRPIQCSKYFDQLKHSMSTQKYYFWKHALETEIRVANDLIIYYSILI